MMKKMLFAVGVWLVSFSAYAQVPYLEEVKALGSVAGQGMACGASKYDTFEMLARAILITKAASDKVQSDGMYAYNRAKADAYFSKQMDGFYDCDAINRRFDAQGIFNMKLYDDGTIAMPDGKVFTPRTPYDVTLVYKSNSQVRENAKAIYDGGNKQASDVKITTDGVEGVQTEATVGAVPNAPDYQATRVGQVITRDQLPQEQPPAVSNEPTVKRISRQYK